MRILNSKYNLFRFIFRFFFKKYAKLSGSFAISTKSQNDLFSAIGLDRQEGIKFLTTIMERTNGQFYDESDNMVSEHWLLFASIAASRKTVKRF